MAAALRDRYEADVELIPSGGGVFEVEVDGHLAYSKKATGRHCEEREVFQAIDAL